MVREQIQRIIHRIDRQMDRMEDELLLTMLTEIRENLLDALKDHAEGLMTETREELLDRLLSEECAKNNEREKILLFLELTGDPGECFGQMGNPDNPEALRRCCVEQGNRIRYFRALEPVREEMLRRLPETEQAEERHVLEQKEQMAAEQFDHALALFRAACAEAQGRIRHERFLEMERQENTAEERLESAEREMRIQVGREILEKDRKEFEEYFSARRIFGNESGYNLRKATERRAEHDSNQRDPAEKEERGTQERDPAENDVQSSYPQYGNRRETDEADHPVHAAESD